MALLLDEKYQDQTQPIKAIVLEGDCVGLAVLVELLMIGLVTRLAQPATANIRWPKDDNQALVDCVMAAAGAAGFDADDMRLRIKQAVYFAQLANDGDIAKAISLADFLHFDLADRNQPAAVLAALESASATMASSGNDTLGLAAAALVIALNTYAAREYEAREHAAI